jgi:antitoxin (DNA-binding transcriptional repressor) of toxin-antitoxin stability system
MITMTATELARNLSRVLDHTRYTSEEVMIVRNKHVVARLVPGTPVMTALEAFSDIAGAISDDEGEAWVRDCEKMDVALDDALRDPWA